MISLHQLACFAAAYEHRSFTAAATELGLAHNETRSWHGWHRHVSLVMLMLAMLAAVRHRANSPAPEKSPDADELRRWCAGRSKRSGASPSV